MDDGDAAGGNAGRPGPDSKVHRLIREHGLETVGDRLAEHWTASGDRRRSLRDLADLFNRRLLEARLKEAGALPLTGSVESAYRVLAGEAKSTGQRVQTRKRLEREGVDVDRLEDDFVSYQAVRTYLQNYRGVSRDAGEGDQLDRELRSVRRLRSRTEAVLENKLARLADGDHLDVGTHRLLLDFRVLCEDCEQYYEVGELLERAGCACSEDDPPSPA